MSGTEIEIERLQARVAAQHLAIQSLLLTLAQEGVLTTPRLAGMKAQMLAQAAERSRAPGCAAQAIWLQEAIEGLFWAAE